MFLRKSNSEKFFKCFQHISVKHRPSWNHLDLKQMRWLFSQQAFLLGGRARAGAGGWRERAAWKGFQPPASGGCRLWQDQYQGERPRKLTEDYEDEVSCGITLQALLFPWPRISSASDVDGKPSGQRLKKRGGPAEWCEAAPVQSLAVGWLHVVVSEGKLCGKVRWHLDQQEGCHSSPAKQVCSNW